MHGDTSISSIKKEKGKRKNKKPCPKESVQPSETYVHMNEHGKRLAYEQVKLDYNLTEIEILRNENKNLEKLVHICDEREHEYEQIVSLRTHLKEARRI